MALRVDTLMLQRTPEWFAARLGKVGASRMDAIMADPGGKKGLVSRRNYCRELAMERRYGTVQENSYLSNAMAKGIELEAEARRSFEFDQNVVVTECGFIEHPRIPMAGASPDGLIGDDAVLELKCPEANNMYEALIHAPLDKKYLYQAQWQLACTGRARAYVAFYREGVPHVAVTTLLRDNALIAKMEAEVQEFLADVAHDTQQLWKERP